MKPISITGILPNVPEKLQTHLRLLIETGVAKVTSLYIADSKSVKVEFTIPITFIAEEIAQSLQDFSEGKLPKKSVLPIPLRGKKG